MDSVSKKAIIVGALLLIVMVASILSGSLIEAVIADPDYKTAVSENQTQVLIGLLLELANAIAVLGIGMLLYPILNIFLRWY